MKKLLAAVFISLIISFAFAGCAAPNDNSPNNDAPPNSEGNVPTENLPSEEVIEDMYITINGNKLKVTLAENTSVNALIEILKQNDIVYTANDYGDFEKVGGIGCTLPTSDTHISTTAGDVMLYCGNQIVLFYGENAWSYTRIGKIEGYSEAQLRSLLGAGEGSVQITLSLN